MKNIRWYASLVACVSLLLASCNEKEMIESIPGESQKMILKGSLETNIVSRSAVTDEGVFYWLEGDKIKVQASDGNFYLFELLEGTGTNNEGHFIGYLPDGETVEDGNWAVSPLDLDVSLGAGGDLRLYLPYRYNWQPNQTNAMMLAKVENGCLSFKNLGGLIKFSVNNIKNKCRMVVTSTTHQISGKMAPVESKGYYELKASRLNGTEESSVEIVSTYEDSKQAFYLPLPVAEGMKLNVKVYEGDDLRVEKNATLSIKRSQLILMPTLALPETNDAVIEDVENATEINDVLSNAVDNGKKDVVVTINSNNNLDEGDQPSSTIEISEPIVIPTELTASEGTSVNLTFDEIPVGTVSGSRVVLTDNSQVDESAESLSEVMIAIPEVTGNTVAPDFDINLPTTTVTLAATQETASYGTVWAKTANNTLIVDEGVTVNNLLTLQGSIEISGIVENLERSKAHGYGDEKTRVLVRKGGRLKNVANAETDFLITVEGDDEPSEDVVVITNIGFARALNWYLKEYQKMDGIELDENGYAIIDRELAESITYIWTGDSSRKNTFTTLDGVEHFVNLESIKSAYGKLEECDFSKNEKLKEVYLQNNNLKSLDFSDNPNMEVIYCPYNSNLTSLNIEGLDRLSDLSVSGTALQSIDISSPESIMLLRLDDMPNLLNSLNFDELINLKTLSVSNTGFNPETLPTNLKKQLTSLTCANNQLEKLDLSDFESLTSLYCNNNSLTSLAFPNTLITTLRCDGNMLTELNISNLTNLENLYCGGQQTGALTLTLNEEQKNKWTEEWVNNNWNNDINISGEDDDNGGGTGDYSGEFNGTVENYEQLVEALKYKSAIITVVKSFDITGPLSINGSAELYLKTNTLTVTASFEKEALITNQGKLLIAAGTIKNGNNGILFSNLSNADLTLAGVTIIDSNEKYFMLNQGTLTIKDNGVEMPSSITGTINNMGGRMYMESGIIVGDIMNQSSGIIIIYSGSITGDLYFPEANMGNQNAAITIVNGVALNGEGWDDERIGRK